MLDKLRGRQEWAFFRTMHRAAPGLAGQVVSVRVISFIEGGSTAAAAAVASLMLAVALFVIVTLDLVQRRVARRG